MNSKLLKKALSVLLAVVLTFGCFSAVIAFAEDLVAINQITFPDAVFRQAIADRYDANADGFLSADERNVSYMSVTGMVEEGAEISSLDGIEYFSNLQTLRCADFKLKALDVSALSKLTELTCPGNKLQTLSLENNPLLTKLNCADNSLTTINVSSNTSLTMLHCYANSLTSIDVSQLTALEDFRCDQNELTSLDVSQNKALTDFSCSYNHLTSLDLSNNALLGNITAYNIGDQEITLPARIDNNTIAVDFSNSGLNEANYVSCSLDDYGDGAGFDLTSFTANDVSQIANGIDYFCYPLLETAENMNVHINVIRTFHQVNFYTSSEMTQLIGKCLVEASYAAQAPTVTELPQCKSFDRWNESVESVNSDMSVYPVWTDSHTYSVSAFDGDIVTVSCSVCQASSYTVSFKSCINAKVGDANYDEYVDVTDDGYINAKDYAKLSQDF